MPRYSEQDRTTLRDQHCEAAVELATTQGWGAVSVRNIAERVKTSASPIHRQGILSLKQDLVTSAFAELKIPLARFMDAYPTPARDEWHTLILAHLKARPEASRLMVQASAQVGITGSEEAKVVSAHFVTEHKRATGQVAGFFHQIDPSAAVVNCHSWAEDLVRWYVAVCVTLVTDPTVTDSWLVAMAKRQNPGS